MSGIRFAIDRHGAGSRAVQPDDHPHRGRLPGPIRAQETSHHARFYPKRNVVYGRFGAVPLGEVMGFNHHVPLTVAGRHVTPVPGGRLPRAGRSRCRRCPARGGGGIILQGDPPGCGSPSAWVSPRQGRWTYDDREGATVCRRAERSRSQLMSNPAFEQNPYFSKTPQPTVRPAAGQGVAPGMTATSAGNPYADYEVANLNYAYQQPAAGPAQTGRMTYDDVIMKTAGVLALIIGAGALNWFVFQANPILTYGGLIAGLILGIVNAVKREPSPALIMGYAVAEG